MSGEEAVGRNVARDAGGGRVRPQIRLEPHRPRARLWKGILPDSEFLPSFLPSEHNDAEKLFQKTPLKKIIYAHPNTRMKYRSGFAVDRIPVNKFKSGVILFFFSGAIWFRLLAVRMVFAPNPHCLGGGTYSVPLPRLASELYQLIEPLCAGCIQVSGVSGMAILCESKVWSKQVEVAVGEGPQFLWAS